MSAEKLAQYVGATPEDQEFVTECWDDAYQLVWNFVGGADVPEQILERAILETGSELFHRRNAPSGIAQFASFDGAPIRVARDPMVGAYKILSKAMVMGF